MLLGLVDGAVSESQRVVIALYCLSNYAPLRKHSILFGWSAASLQTNFHMFIDQVIDHLDAPDSRKLYAMLSGLARVCTRILTCRVLPLPLAYRINGWTFQEQEDWIAHPFGPEEFHDCIGAVDATYIRVERPKKYWLERRLYSTYKKYHSLYFVAVIDRGGKEQQTSNVEQTTADLYAMCVCPLRLHSLRRRRQLAHGQQRAGSLLQSTVLSPPRPSPTRRCCISFRQSLHNRLH